MHYLGQARTHSCALAGGEHNGKAGSARHSDFALNFAASDASHSRGGWQAKARRPNIVKDGKSGIWRILLMFSMIRPSRTPWRSSRRRSKSIRASHVKAGATFLP